MTGIHPIKCPSGYLKVESASLCIAARVTWSVPGLEENSSTMDEKENEVRASDSPVLGEEYQYHNSNRFIKVLIETCVTHMQHVNAPHACFCKIVRAAVKC